MNFEKPITKAKGEMGEVIVARLSPKSDLKESIKKIAEDEGISSGLILGGAASLRRAVLRLPKVVVQTPPITDEHRVLVEKEEAMELASIMGNIAEIDGELFIHAHLTVAVGNEGGQVYGGHMEEGCLIYTTGEIAIARLKGIQLPRLYDEETKNKEMCPKEI